MGSAIGVGTSIWQYRKQSGAAKKAARQQEAERRRAEALAPAEAQVADDDGAISEMMRKRKGVQSTMLASKQSARANYNLGAE